MSRRPPALVVVVLALLLPLLGGASLPPSLSARVTAVPVVERAESRLATEGKQGVKGLRATFYVAAPRERVLATLWDVDRFLEIFPDIKKLDVLEKRQDSVDVKFTVDAVLATVSYTLRRDLDRERGSIRWREIGGDLTAARGSWTVTTTAHPDVSRVVYTSFVDVGRFVPESMVRDLAMDKVSEMAGRVRAACAKVPPAPASQPALRTGAGG